MMVYKMIFSKYYDLQLYGIMKKEQFLKKDKYFKQSLENSLFLSKERKSSKLLTLCVD